LVALIKNFKFFLFLLIIVCSCIYLISSFINSIFVQPISNKDRLIIIKKNINETTFLNYLNSSQIKVSKIKWHISKFFLKDKFLGITEYLANKTKSKKYAMLIYNKKLSVCPLTTHLPLKQVSKKLSKKLIFEKVKLINNFFKKYSN